MYNKLYIYQNYINIINNISVYIFRNINIYAATVPDRMHHLDLGLFRYQVEFTCEILKLQHSGALVDELNYRLSEIPRYQDLKIFSNGLQIVRLTANEY